MGKGKGKSQNKIPVVINNTHLEAFEKYKGIHDFFQKSGEIVNFHRHYQEELLLAYRKAEDPYYNYSMSCPACVAEFLTKIYRWYDNLSKAKPNEVYNNILKTIE